MDIYKKKPEVDPVERYSAKDFLRYKNIWRSIGFILILVIIILSLMPDPERVTPLALSDKLMHAIAYGVSMIWFGLCYRGKKLFIIAAGLILLGIILEIIQGQTGYRTMSLYDIMANFVGVIMGLAFSFSRFSNLLQYVEERLLK